MSIFYPDMMFDRVSDIDFEKLHSRGIRGIIFDIDNTLVPYTQPNATKKEIRIIDNAKAAGLQVAFASNNSKERVALFNKTLGLPATHRASKPLTRALRKIADDMGLPVDQVALIGDQVFTDVYGANRCGMVSILVNPIESQENLFFKLKRSLEKRVIKRMKKKAQRGK